MIRLLLIAAIAGLTAAAQTTVTVEALSPREIAINGISAGSPEDAAINYPQLADRIQRAARRARAAERRAAWVTYLESQMSPEELADPERQLDPPPPGWQPGDVLIWDGRWLTPERAAKLDHLNDEAEQARQEERRRRARAAAIAKLAAQEPTP